MASVGSASIQLKLDRKQFDADLQKLSQQSAPSLRIRLDTQDFERQVKGLAGFIAPVSIPVVLDTTKLNAQIAAIKNVEIKAKLVVDDSAIKQLKIAPQFELFEVGEEFSNKISDAIEKGFKKSQPKPPSTFSRIFSGVGDVLLAPLKGITTGAFEGVGLQLSKQLGLGLSRGIESQLSSVIGSFDLLGEKLITSAVPKLGNTAGGKIAGAILNSAPMQKLRSDLANQITGIVGETEQLIASQSGKQQAKQRQGQQQKLAQKEIAGQLQQSIATAPQRQQQAQGIKQQLLPQYQQEIKSRESQLAGLQADRELLVSAGTETEEIKQAVDEIDLQIAEASSALVEAKKGQQFLQQQIASLLGETSGVVGKLKSAGANTSSIEGIDFALKESTGKGQELIARLDGNIQIQQANIKEARSRVKLYKQQEAQFKQDAIAALGNGDEATARQLLTESKKSGLRANAAQQEVGAYKDNISEILKIRQEALKGFVEERKKLREKLESETQKLADDLSAQEVAIAPVSTKKINPKARTKSAAADIQPIKLDTSVQKELPPSPQIFKDVVAQFSAITGMSIAPGKIPQLVRGAENAKYNGKYSPTDNTIALPAGRYDALAQGIITPDLVKTLMHELRHAMQTAFGDRTLTKSTNPEFQLIKGAPEEMQQLGGKIQGSADFFKKGALNATPADVETVKVLEEDAYVFAERYFQQVFKSIQQGLQSGVQSPPSEAELIKQVQQAQSTITANLKQSFKGPARDRKVTNPELAGSTLSEIDGQIAFAAEQLQRTDLSGEAKKKLGQFRGTLERQYRTYSPALKAKLFGGIPLGSSGVQSSTQSQGVELFEVSDDLLKEFERQTRAAERRARRVLGNIFKNSNRAAKRANKALQQLEQETNQQVADIEASNTYNEAQSSRRTRRTLQRIQRGYGGNIDAPTIETEAPRVEQDIPKPVEKGFLGGLKKEFRLARLSALTKQAEYLGQQAQVLLTDVDAQIALGKSQEKEAQLIQKQIQQNERKLNGILSSIKRANSGKDPKLTPGDVQRLSGEAETLTGRVDADKQRLAAIQPNIKNGKELEPVAKNLRAGITGASEAGKNQNINELEKQNTLIRENLKLLGEPPPPTNLFDNILGSASKLSMSLPNLMTIVKGFLAFQVGMWAQNFFGSIAQETFKAYVELDRLKTALNFASGGTAGGTQNLAFVKKTVEDLKVPLKASAEGFVQLAAAAKGSVLEGKETRELFQGISEASTVLSLSAEDTQGVILALSQMISKGKVSAEELRQQLGERLPGAMGIFARAAGMTEEQLDKLVQSGQAIAPDLLAKFSRQLHSEFGDAAKDASGNAQSAIFDLQNSFLSLQQGIGEGVSPAAILGFGVFSGILKGLASVAKELGFILLGVTVALGVKMVGALQAVIAQLIATKFATGTLSGGLASLGQTINNSFSVKLTAGIFAVLEIINLLNQAVNTELTTSFNKAAESAKRAAEESAKAFKKTAPNQISTTEPVASSGVGRFFDNFLIKPLNYLDAATPGVHIPLGTYGELERDRVTQNTADITDANSDFLGSARRRLGQLQTGSGDIGQIPAIDASLKDAEMQRQILQAGIKRNFTDKGLAIPAQDKRRLEAQNLKITDLNNQRADIAKPFTLDLSRADQQINAIKAQIESLKSPEGIAAVGGGEAALKLTEDLNASMERLKQFKAEAESTLASLRVDPVLAFTNALRKLNLTLAESQEKDEQKFNLSKAAIAKNQVTGFSTNKLATRNAALQNAVAERDKNQGNVSALEEAVRGTDATINAPEFQATLTRLGATPDSSIAKIDDLLKNTSDDADKGILEKLKSAKEQKNKLSEARAGLSESQLKVKQTTQDNSLFNIEEGAANSRARTQKNENELIATFRRAQVAKVMVEEVANEQIARIQLGSTQRQQKSLEDQLTALRVYHAEGKISAEEFAKRERDLTLEQTNLEKQEAENRLSVQQAMLQRRMKELEFANKKAEALTTTKSADATREAKEKLLASGLTPQAQDQFALSSNKIDQTATLERIALIQKKLADNRQLFNDKLIHSREYQEQELALNQELAQANVQLVDQKIAAEEKYRETVEHAIQRIMQAEDNRFKSLSSQLEYQKAGLELYNQSLERTAKLEESRFNLSKALSDAAISPLEIKKDNASRALELSRKLKDDNLDPGVGLKINSQLNALGFGNSEIQILQKRSQIEDAIAAKKLEALKLEQEFQRKSLQLDLQRQKISAETAVYDAQSAQLSAAKSKLEAEAALRIAKLKKDPQAIEAAQIGLEIAGREIDLSDKKLNNAIANLGIQDELASNATKAQDATQKTAIDQQLAADAARKQADSLEKAEALAPKQSDSSNANNGKPEQNYNFNLTTSSAQLAPVATGATRATGGKGKRIIKDGVDITGYQYDESLNRSQGNAPASDFDLPKKLYINQLPELNRKPGENLFEAYQKFNEQRQMPPVDNTAAMIKATQIQPEAKYTQFGEALKFANQEVVTRLDKLIEASNTPRSLTVSTPNPVDDAAKIMNDLSRGQVVGAGL